MIPQPSPQQLDQMIQSWQAWLDAKILERHSLTSLCGYSGMIADGIALADTDTADRDGLKDALFNLWTAQGQTIDVDIAEISANLKAAKEMARQARSGIQLAGAMPPTIPSTNRKP